MYVKSLHQIYYLHEGFMSNLLRKTLTTTAPLLSLLTAPMVLIGAPVQANEIHLAADYSADQLRGARIGYRWTNLDWPVTLPAWLGSPRLHAEAALNTWQNSNNTSDNLTALTMSPVISWSLTDGNRPLQLEAGIGVSYFEKTTLGDRRLSTQFQFEDRIGLTWQYSTTSTARLGLHYFHYSNADLDQPNDGLDFFRISWHYPI